MKIFIDRLNKYLSFCFFCTVCRKQISFPLSWTVHLKLNLHFHRNKEYPFLFCCDQISEGRDSRLGFETKGTKTLGIVSVSLQF